MNLNDLLQNDRFKNVLLAGISKASAKLAEQSHHCQLPGVDEVSSSTYDDKVQVPSSESTGTTAGVKAPFALDTINRALQILKDKSHKDGAKKLDYQDVSSDEELLDNPPVQNSNKTKPSVDTSITSGGQKAVLDFINRKKKSSQQDGELFQSWRTSLNKSSELFTNISTGKKECEETADAVRNAGMKKTFDLSKKVKELSQKVKEDESNLIKTYGQEKHLSQVESDSGNVFVYGHDKNKAAGTSGIDIDSELNLFEESLGLKVDEQKKKSQSPVDCEIISTSNLDCEIISSSSSIGSRSPSPRNKRSPRSRSLSPLRDKRLRRSRTPSPSRIKRVYRSKSPKWRRYSRNRSRSPYRKYSRSPSRNVSNSPSRKSPIPRLACSSRPQNILRDSKSEKDIQKEPEQSNKVS